MSDPMDPGTDLGTPDPSAGTPTPTAADPTKDARIAELEQENAKLREDRRAERARALGAEHKLPASVVELLKTVPADQMEEKAKTLSAELHPAPAGSPSPPAGGPAPTDPGTPPAEPSAPADPTLESFERVPGGDPPDPALGFQDELLQRVNGAKSLEEIEQIQQEFKRRQRTG